MSRLRTLTVTLLSAAALTAAWTQFPTTAQATTPASQKADSKAAIAAAVDGKWRSAEDKARDANRHPRESLEFWGLQPGMTILEVQPGGGYWTDILAPFARATGGQYYATGADLDNPETSAGARKSRADFEAKLASKPDVYGKAKFVNWGAKSAPLPENTFDFILTARSVHGWMGSGIAEKVFADFARGLKPGGILALEQHRGKPGTQDPKASTGYVSEAHVIDLAKKAGLELVSRSEINANPKDTADHPFGVWTLPPTRRTRPYSEGASAHDPNFDRAKYDAIGESDRMTLKFRKPK
jgi:predicted methyltransferase